MNIYIATLTLTTIASLATLIPAHDLVARVGDWLAQGRQVRDVAPTSTRGPAHVRTVQFVDGIALGWCE